MAKTQSRNQENRPGDVDAHPSESFVTTLLARHSAGVISRLEVLDAVFARCREQPAVAADIFGSLQGHPDESARWIGSQVQELLRKCEAQVKDIRQIRRNSPLRSAAQLTLSGGYAHVPSNRQWWLNGREYYVATFIDFVEQGAGKMPIALAKLDDEIDMVEASGQWHKGRYALLKLLYVADWAERETVTVHIVESLPEDVESFYATHPFGTEIESHATYTVIADG